MQLLYTLLLQLYCAHVLTKQRTCVPEGSDLGVGQAGEQGQQGGEEVLVINDAVLTGAHQNLNELTQAGFEALHHGARDGQRVVD